MRSLDCFNISHSSSRTIALGSTQSLTELSTRNLPRGKNVAGAKGLTTTEQSLSRFSTKCGILDVSQINRPPMPVKRIALITYLFTSCYIFMSVNEDLSLDKPLHVIYQVSKLAYRI
jgi:hypothetical protein